MKTKTVVMIFFSLWIGSGPRAGAAEIPRNAGTKRAKPASDSRLRTSTMSSMYSPGFQISSISPGS